MTESVVNLTDSEAEALRSIRDNGAPVDGVVLELIELGLIEIESRLTPDGIRALRHHESSER